MEKVKSSKKKKIKSKDAVRELSGLEKEARFLLEKYKDIEPTERGFLAEYIRMLKLNSRLIHKLKLSLLKDPEKLDTRGIYALATLMSSQREVIADIRNLTDFRSQAQMLIELVLQPMVSGIGQTLLSSFYQQKKLIEETVKPKERSFALKQLDSITKDVSQSLQLNYEQATVKMMETLVGPTDEKPKKRRKTTG